MTLKKNTHIGNKNFSMQGTLNAEPLEEFDAQTICFKLTIIKMTTAPKCVKMSIVKKFV